VDPADQMMVAVMLVLGIKWVFVTICGICVMYYFSTIATCYRISDM
jgi:hypothetical protein